MIEHNMMCVFSDLIVGTGLLAGILGVCWAVGKGVGRVIDAEYKEWGFFGRVMLGLVSMEITGLVFLLAYGLGEILLGACK